MRQFYDFDLEGRIITVVENDTLSLWCAYAALCVYTDGPLARR